MYIKNRILGRGAYGIAWLAKDTETGASVVIKELTLAQLPAAERERALREANLLSQLFHPNIVSYKQSFLENGALNIITEYANKGDLQNFMRSSSEPFDEPFITYVATQILNALIYLHSHNVIHRDVKPANIFLAKTTVESSKERKYPFRVMLGDFGIAKVLGESSLATTLVGTPYYLSPELISKHMYSTKSDIWSLGVTLYELAAQKRPFTGRTIVSVAMQIVEGKYDPLPEKFSKPFCNAIYNMLEKEEKRRSDAAEALAMFGVLASAGQSANGKMSQPGVLTPIVLNTEYTKVLRAELAHRYKQLYQKAQTVIGRELLDKSLRSIIKLVLENPSVECIHAAVAQHFSPDSTGASNITDLVVCITHSWLNTGSFTVK
ncbi:Kinase, NEK [Giardia duodenalis]|uniref:non-specific serine/threonine protein kinase n=1 Tax=Giardia intestinalis (strain ATCC 50803 / WB clone C6) TaxID=184922 RepID=A8BZJ9_GIAIC|nr:Kinase, NEK [Giardia intestinalis]KAE8305459.1 Kinase, NEK [Giardia intestinalis]|eukprot:XP_001704014.1 Kinase, NEK [Giardia lamblia ATCC 50803]